MPANQKSTAFTLVETLAAMGIIAILVVIVAPVMTKAKEKAGETNCVSNLQSLQKTIALYRTEYDGDGVYGKASVMGLPSGEILGDLQGVSSYRCNATPSASIRSDRMFPYFYAPSIERLDHSNPSWEEYSLRYGESSVLFQDLNHNPKDLPMMSMYVTKYGLGISLGGAIIRQRKSGNEMDKTWWNE